MDSEEIQLRVYGEAALPTLVYLPGLHGDWTLVASFRAALNGRVRFVEVTYPRTLTWTIDDYANTIRDALVENGIARGWLLAESSKCIQAVKHKEKNIYGVLFHPEVRNQEILKKFIQLKQ